MPQPPRLMLSAAFLILRAAPLVLDPSSRRLRVPANGSDRERPDDGGIAEIHAQLHAGTFFVRRILGTDRLQMKRGESAKKNHTSEQNHLKSIAVQL
jgi:hypothetical protein